MMSDPSSVDRTTFDELTGKLVLLIDESRAWQDTPSMHRQLSAKVRHYVRYIRSESFAGEYDQRPQDTIVRLVSKEPPANESTEFFERISYELGKNGIDFEYQVGAEGVPVLVSPGAAAPPPTASGPTPQPPPPPSQAPIEAPRDADGVLSAPEVAGPGFEAELAAEIDEALEALEAGSLEPDEPEHVAEPPEPPQPAAPTPAAESQDHAPSFSSPDQLEEGLAKRDVWELEYLEEGPSELEMLIEAPDDVASRYIGLDEEPAAAPEAAIPEEVEVVEPPSDAERTHPPFFPEEEFGRALPQPGEVQTLLRGVETEPFEPAIIETASGKRIRLEVPGAAATPRPGRTDETAPSLRRAIGAALGAGIAGAIIWAALAIPAGKGASPLALAVALMVGMSVRLRGAGQTNAFRLVGCLGTIFGSALGALLATVALTAWSGGQGLEGAVNLFVDPASLWAAIKATFGVLDLVSLLVAVYLAYKISASAASE